LVAPVIRTIRTIPGCTDPHDPHNALDLFTDKTDFEGGICAWLHSRFHFCGADSRAGLPCDGDERVGRLASRFCFHVQVAPLGPPPACAPPRPLWAVQAQNCSGPPTHLNAPIPRIRDSVGCFCTPRPRHHTTVTARATGSSRAGLGCGSWTHARSPASTHIRIQTHSCSHDPPEAAELHASIAPGNCHLSGAQRWSSCPCHGAAGCLDGASSGWLTGWPIDPHHGRVVDARLLFPLFVGRRRPSFSPTGCTVENRELQGGGRHT